MPALTVRTTLALMGILLSFTLPAQGAVHLTMSRHAPSGKDGSTGELSMVQALMVGRRRSLSAPATNLTSPLASGANLTGLSDGSGLDERAIKMAMHPHTHQPRHPDRLDKRQSSSAYVSSTGGDPDQPSTSYRYHTTTNLTQASSTASAGEAYSSNQYSQQGGNGSASQAASSYPASGASDNGSIATTLAWGNSSSSSATIQAAEQSTASSAYTDPSGTAIASTQSMSSGGGWKVDTKTAHSATGTISATHPAETLAIDGVTGLGILYTIDVTVDGVTLPVHIDTGSSQFWAAHSTCDGCRQGGMTTINTPLPANCDAEGVRKEILYAKGMVSGCMVNSTLTFGDDTQYNYPILAVTNATEDTTIQGSFYSGRIGLAGNELTLEKGPTVISALYQQNLIQTPVVGFYLPHADEASESEITFGDPATSEHADPSRQITLPSVGGPNEHYIVSFDVFGLNRTVVSGAGRGYLDTGWSGVGIPESLKDFVHSEIYVTPKNAEKGVSAPCQSPTGATLSFTFGQQTFEIDYKDLVTLPDGEGICWALISGVPENSQLETQWVLGDAFLHNVYHSVNVETGEVKLFGLKNDTSQYGGR